MFSHNNLLEYRNKLTSRAYPGDRPRTVFGEKDRRRACRAWSRAAIIEAGWSRSGLAVTAMLVAALAAPGPDGSAAALTAGL
ncbi:hypothetical protein [Nocardia gamkensis]|uniref:Uncharacterized protein n=1 Tax=Nocardia gamkensis TaxID=352869 RepID=A0A7X6L8M3_9NOCA|nr:hypothetical protein [Nocardia gamkensis]NKY29787.1 hypothetical protein [Nocardia gamkensis]